MSFIARNPLSAAKLETSPPSPAEGTRGLFPKEDGWYDIDEDGTENQLTSSAQTASYVICAEDSVNKEGAIVVQPSVYPDLSDAYPNYLQNALDTIFNSAEFKQGSKILIRRGTYHDTAHHGMAPLNLNINKPCTIEFETSGHFGAVILGKITLASFSALGHGGITLRNAYCQYIDVCSANNLIENCRVFNIAPGADATYSEGSIIVSSHNNIIRNNLGYGSIYLTASSDEKYAQRCMMYDNYKITGESSDYIQATGYLGTDIYAENSIEGTEYIKSFVPVKSVSANGAELTPDDAGNVDIPLASDAVPGVVKVTNYTYGVDVAPSGNLSITAAKEEHIKQKTNNYRPITPKYLDYAVKCCTNQGSIENLTDEQLKLPPSTKVLKDIAETSKNKIESISTNGITLTPNENKNVNIPMAENNNITIMDEDTWEVIMPDEVIGVDGLMSKEDKYKLENIAIGAQKNKIEKIKLGDTKAIVTDKTVTIPYAIAPAQVEAASVEEDTLASSGARAPIIVPDIDIGVIKGVDGLMTKEDKLKLDNIGEYAQENIIEKIQIEGEEEALPIIGGDLDIPYKTSTIPLASENNNGVMSSNDKVKLDGVEEGAQANIIESISANGTVIEPDENKNVDIPLKAQTASYVICAEDSVNKEGAIVVANPTTMPYGLENNLQYALNAIFDSEDFINGAEIVIRRGTYFGDSGYANYVDLKIYKACTIRFEDTRQQQYIRVIYLDSTRVEGTYGKSGFINLIGAYCHAIDIGVRGCVVEDCVVMGDGDTYTSGAIVVSRRNNTIRNNCVPYIYFTGTSETMFAEKCHCYGNKTNWGDRVTPTTYVQADGFIDTEGDIYEVNDIEGTAYIKEVIAETVPEEDVTFAANLRNRTNGLYGSLSTLPEYGTNQVIDGESVTITMYANNVYVLPKSGNYTSIAITLQANPTTDLNGYAPEDDKSMLLFNTELMFKTPADVPCNFSYHSNIKFVGTDVENGVFIPQMNMMYDIIITASGKMTVPGADVFYYFAYVSGYEVSE